MDNRFLRCLDEGKLKKIPIQADLVQKELDGAKSDLAWAEKSGSDGNPKWAIVQAYYSMFHSAKALVLSKGYAEKSHFCLLIAFKALFVDSGLTEKKYSDWLRDSMALRHDADYGLTYSSDSAGEAVSWAREFFTMAKKLVSKK